GEVILADEPTGALDSRSGEELLKLLSELHRDGHTIIVVTHDPQVAGRADRIIEIRDGAIVADRRKTPAAATPGLSPPETPRKGLLAAAVSQFGEALRMAI